MKHAYENHFEIAREFINGIFFGGCVKYSRNAHTDGTLFWSYSTPVAHKVCKARGGVVVDSYFHSYTTRRQTREIEGYAERWGWPVVHCGIIAPTTTRDHQQNKGEIIDRIWHARTKYQRARSESSRLHWCEIAEAARRELCLYNEIFGLSE